MEGADEGEMLVTSGPAGGKRHPRFGDGAAPSDRFPFPASENLPVSQTRQEMCGESKSKSRAPSRRWRVPATPLLLLAYVTYLLLGSAAFRALEGPVERDSAHHLLQEKWELLENHTCLKGEALERLVKVLTRRGGAGGGSRIPRSKGMAAWVGGRTPSRDAEAG